MTKLDERLAIADLYYRLIERVRRVLKFTPDDPHARTSQMFCDQDGRWWVFTAEACLSEDEAQVVINRFEAGA